MEGGKEGSERRKEEGRKEGSERRKQKKERKKEGGQRSCI